ncbi:MAG: hypothetical protein J6A49_04295 [Clostridia bacterium]|nr:hypothetical protein [Clostridia bacterium]
MRTKKALAVLLAVVMLAVPFAVMSYAAPAIVTAPVKTVYTDCEYFNPQGLVISDGENTIEYTPTDADFSFVPALNEYLSVAKNADGEDVETTYVEVYYKNQYAGSVEITVNHVLGEVTNLGEAGHGQYCLGCGEVHNYEAHTIPEFIPNDDGGLFLPQTQTGVCEICKGEVTENIPDSENFFSIIGTDMTAFELQIFLYLDMILVTLIQTLAGIR